CSPSSRTPWSAGRPRRGRVLTDDALLSMPPQPEEWQGHDAIAEFLADRFATHVGRRVRLIPTRANGQPAFGHYIADAHTPVGGSSACSCSRSTAIGSPPARGRSGQPDAARWPDAT